MLHLYSRFTEGPFILTLVLLSTLVFTAALWLYQRFLPRFRFAEDSNEEGAIYAAGIGTIFALIFAFVIIAVWQNFAQVSATVSQEANILHNIYRNLDGYPPELRDPARTQLRAYVDRVVTVEWPLLATGDQDPVAHEQITALSNTITQYKPATIGELPLQQEMLQLLLNNRNLRHDRIRGGAPYLDIAMWWSLLLGIVLLMLFSCMLNVPSRRQHYLMHGVLGASIGVVLFLLLVYNYPFMGPGAIGPEPLKVLPEQFWVVK